MIKHLTDVRDGQAWGPWRLRAYNLTLILLKDGHWLYEVDLEGIKDSATMLGCIFHISKKTWATEDEDITVCLLAAFNDLFDPQHNLCPYGNSKAIDPTQHFAWLNASS